MRGVSRSRGLVVGCQGHPNSPHDLVQRMPYYVFRRDIIQPNDAKNRSLVDNLDRAMREVQKSLPRLQYDLASANADIDAGGERIEMKVGEDADIGWHLDQADTLAKYGILATRFKGA